MWLFTGYFNVNIWKLVLFSDHHRGADSGGFIGGIPKLSSIDKSSLILVLNIYYICKQYEKYEITCLLYNNKLIIPYIVMFRVFLNIAITNCS
jgi:hypothetical protein